MNNLHSLQQDQGLCFIWHIIVAQEGQRAKRRARSRRRVRTAEHQAIHNRIRRRVLVKGHAMLTWWKAVNGPLLDNLIQEEGEKPV